MIGIDVTYCTLPLVFDLDLLFLRLNVCVYALVCDMKTAIFRLLVTAYRLPCLHGLPSPQKNAPLLCLFAHFSAAHQY